MRRWPASDALDHRHRVVGPGGANHRLSVAEQRQRQGCQQPNRSLRHHSSRGRTHQQRCGSSEDQGAANRIGDCLVPVVDRRRDDRSRHGRRHRGVPVIVTTNLRGVGKFGVQTEVKYDIGANIMENRTMRRNAGA